MGSTEAYPCAFQMQTQGTINNRQALFPAARVVPISMPDRNHSARIILLTILSPVVHWIGNNGNIIQSTYNNR